MKLSPFETGALWANLTTDGFRDLPHPERMTVILPLAGFADWGLGRPLDLEEHLLASVFGAAADRIRDLSEFLVLPPLRFLHAPYDHTFFGLDPDEVEDQIREMARSVKASGFKRLVFFNANPWNEELVESLALDLRVDLGLSTFCLHLAALGLDLHPGRSSTRADAQCAASAAFGIVAEEPNRPTRESLTWFRPGRYDQPAPLQTQRSRRDAIEKGQSILRSAGDQMVQLLREIAAHPERVDPPLSESAANAKSPVPDLPTHPVFRSRYLPALTRQSIESLPGKQAAVVVIPVGAIEQHGSHLPVGTDAILSQMWLQSALEQLPSRIPVYVGPALSVGKSIEHLGFPGTLSLSGRLLRHNLLAIARQLQTWGFQTLAVLNTHGGNSNSLVVALREIQDQLGMQAGMLRPSLTRSASEQENAFGFHAGEVETSLMLTIAPDLVEMAKAGCEYPAHLDDPGGLRPVKGAATWAWTTKDISETGVMGDATAATPEKGRDWLEEGGRELADDLRRLTDEFPN